MKEFQEYTGANLYDFCCGYVLTRKQILEEPLTKETEKIIKNYLRRYKAGTYDANRAVYIQRILLEIRSEVLGFSENLSKFYIRKENKPGYASLDDADVEGMTDWFYGRYPDIDVRILDEWVRYLIYIWYIR